MEEPDSAEGELNAGFKRYLKKEAMLSQALAHKWLGVDAGENGKGARIGEAIAWCKDAQTRLQVMEDGAVREKMKGLGIGKSNDRKKEERRARKGRVKRDLEDVGAWVKTYTRQNDTVGHLQIWADRETGDVKAEHEPSGLVPAGTWCRYIDEPVRSTDLCGQGFRATSASGGLQHRHWGRGRRIRCRGRKGGARRYRQLRRQGHILLTRTLMHCLYVGNGLWLWLWLWLQ